MARKYGDAHSQVTQIARETTAGTPVAATRRLASMAWMLSPDMEISKLKPRGAKLATGHSLNQEWATAEIEGTIAFNEIQYALASAMSMPTITDLVLTYANTTPYTLGQLVKPGTPNGHIYKVTTAGTSGGSPPTFPTGTGATVTSGTVVFTEAGADTQKVGKHVFGMSQFQSDDPAIFTVENGDLRRNRGRRSSYCLINELTLASERQGEVEVGGSLIGQRNNSFAPTTSGLTEVEPIEATPTMVRMYLDNSAANIGTTRYMGNFQFEFGISDRYGTVWTHNDDLTSFEEHNETEPEITLEMTVADEAGLDDIITSIRTNSRKFCVIRFTGPQIGSTGVNYQLDLKMALSVSEAPSFTDNEGTYASELTFEVEYDPTLQYGVQAELITDSITL